MQDIIQDLSEGIAERNEPTKIVLRYAGSDVDDGSIAVDDLLSALNGFSGAFYKIAERMSPDSKQRIKITGITRSSANVHLEIFQWAQAHPAVSAAVLSSAGYVGKKFVDLVVSKISSVAKAKKHIQNGPIITSVLGNNNQVVIINGVNAALPVEKDVLEMLQQGTIDSELDKMSAPLREDAIDVFEIKHEGAEGADLHLDASDRPYFARSRREATRTAELTLIGTMSTISKSSNAGVFVTDSGRRIRYRFTSEDQLPELYRQFAHLGQVRIRCIAKLDENLDVISIDVSSIEPLQEQLPFESDPHV